MEPFMQRNRLYKLEGNFREVVCIRIKTNSFLRFFLEELVEYIELSPKAHVATQWKEMYHLLPQPLCDVYKPKSWKHIFTKEAVQNSLARVQIAGYDEKLVRYFLFKYFLFRAISLLPRSFNCNH